MSKKLTSKTKKKGVNEEEKCLQVEELLFTAY